MWASKERKLLWSLAGKRTVAGEQGESEGCLNGDIDRGTWGAGQPGENLEGKIAIVAQWAGLEARERQWRPLSALRSTHDLEWASHLEDKEVKVAKKVKGLIRKYRFNDAVEKKGDEARIHVGVMAQDLKEAFESEGLVAEKYSMFCSDTWEEDGVSKTRLGVRYGELFAFIIAAL